MSEQLDGDGWDLPIYPPVCSYCRHLDIGSDRRPGVCTAFPGGIPRAIWLGENNHQQPYPGDHGIQFSSEAFA